MSAVPAARRTSGGRCRPQQPTDRLRLKGFYQPLAAAAWQLKEQSSPKIRLSSGAPLWVPVFGAEAVGRTAIFYAHRPTGRERSEALARPTVLRTKTQNKKSFFSTGRGAFSFSKKMGGGKSPPHRGGKLTPPWNGEISAAMSRILPSKWRIPAAICRPLPPRLLHDS